MRTFTVNMGEEEYNIECSSGESSATTEYGSEPACLEIDGDIYYCYVTDPDEQSPVVYKVDSVSACPTVAADAKFEDADDEEPGPVLVETDETA